MKPSLEDFLKCKKVRCVVGVAGITTGKVYDVIGLDENYVHVIDDNSKETHYWYCRFEPVLDSAENPLQEMKLTPELETEASEPKFKAGDKVYVGLTGKIAQVTEIIDDDVVNVANKNNEVRAWVSNICHATTENYERLQATFPCIEFEQPPKASEPKFKAGDKVYFSTDPDIKTISEVGNDNDVQFVGEFGWASGYSCCHATQENYEILCKLYPHIEFEKPTKELTGSDLCRAMLDKGWVSVPCYISDESDYEADNNAFCALIGKFDKCFKELDTNYEHEYAVPFDPRTGEPLTEAVLDE